MFNQAKLALVFINKRTNVVWYGKRCETREGSRQIKDMGCKKRRTGQPPRGVMNTL